MYIVQKKIMKTFYVSAHSGIHRSHIAAPVREIPPNTYVIMTTVCGRYSLSTNTNFTNKWLRTPEGINALAKHITQTGNMFVNGKRIFRPGDVGPVVNQILSFNQKSNQHYEHLFLGITEAPLGAVNLYKSANSKIRRTSAEHFSNLLFKLRQFVYINGTYAYYDSVNSGNNNGTEESVNITTIEPRQFDSLDISEKIYAIQTLFSDPILGNGLNIAADQLLKALHDSDYADKLMSGEIPIRSFNSGDVRMSGLLAQHGPGVYIIDTCRAIRHTTISNNLMTLRILNRVTNNGKSYKQVVVPIDPVAFEQSMLGVLDEEEKQNIRNRWEYFRRVALVFREHETERGARYRPFRTWTGPPDSFYTAP